MQHFFVHVFCIGVVLCFGLGFLLVVGECFLGTLDIVYQLGFFLLCDCMFSDNDGGRH
jgi:hypothetical protein